MCSFCGFWQLPSYYPTSLTIPLSVTRILTHELTSTFSTLPPASAPLALPLSPALLTAPLEQLGRPAWLPRWGALSPPPFSVPLALSMIGKSMSRNHELTLFSLLFVQLQRYFALAHLVPLSPFLPRTLALPPPLLSPTPHLHLSNLGSPSLCQPPLSHTLCLALPSSLPLLRFPLPPSHLPLPAWLAPTPFQLPPSVSPPPHLVPSPSLPLSPSASLPLPSLPLPSFASLALCLSHHSLHRPSLSTASSLLLRPDNPHRMSKLTVSSPWFLESNYRHNVTMVVMVRLEDPYSSVMTMRVRSN
jgi:hypothetical protein